MFEKLQQFFSVYFLSSSINLGINSHPRSIVPRPPFAHSLSQNLTALPLPIILSPEISTGTGVSLCTFKTQGVAWSVVMHMRLSLSEICFSRGPKKYLSMAEIICVFRVQFPS